MRNLANLFHFQQKKSPPIEPFEIKTDQKRRKVFLRYINRAWLGLAIVTLITLPIFPEQRRVFVYLIAVILPTYLLVRFLNMSERTWLAGLIFTLSVNYGFFGLFLVLVADEGASKAFATEATVWMLMGLGVLFAGAFVHKRAAPILALLNSILLIVTRLALAPDADPRPAPLVFWWMLAVTIWLYEGTLSDAFGRVLAELAVRRQAEESMRESEFKYRLLFENMQEGFSLHEIILDENGKAVDFRFITANEAYEKHTGFKRQEVIGRTMREILPQVDPRQIENYGKVALTGEPEIIEYYSPAFDRYFRVRAFSAEHGRFATIFEDITERKQAEESLRESEERYRNLFNTMEEGVAINEIILDEHGDAIDYMIVDVNPAFERQSPYKFDQALGKRATELYKMSTEFIRDWWKEHAQRITTAQIEYFHEPSGRWFFITTTLPENGRFATIFLNITERKQAEQELRKAETKYRTLVEQIHPIVYVSEPHQHIGITYISPQIKTLGFTQEEWIADPELWLRQLHPDDRARVMKEIEEVARSGLPFKSEYRIKTGAGDIRWLLDEVMDIQDENGDVLFRQGFMLDITERRVVEEAIQTTNTLLEQTLEQSPVPMILVSLPDGIIRSANSASRRFLGVDDEPSPVGTRLAELEISWKDFDIHGNPGSYEDLPLPRSLAGLKTDPQERQIVRKDGTSVYGLMYGSPIFDSAGSLIAGYLVMIDITERKQAEEAASQRLIEQRILHQVSQSLLTVHLDLETIYTTLHQAVVQIMPCEAFNIVLDDRSGGDYHAVYLFDVDRRFPSQRIPRGQGLSGKVIPNGETLFIHDNQQSNVPAFRYGTSSSVRSILAVPLRKENETIGMVTAQSYQPNAYNERHRVLLETLAAQVTTIIENARLFEETARRAQEFASLFETSNTLSGGYNLDTLLRSIVENARKLLNAASSGIYLAIPNTDELELSVDTEPYIPFGSRMRIGDGMAGRVAQTRLPLRVDDYSTWEGRSLLYEGRPMRAVLEVPMLYQGELIGVLTADEVGESTRIFTEADEHLLSLFASQAAGAIHSTRLREETTNRLRELGLLFESGLALGQLLNPKVIAQKIIDLLDQKMDWHHTAIRLYNAADKTLELLAYNVPGIKDDHERAAIEERFKKGVARSGQGLSGWAVQHAQVVRSNHLNSDARYVNTFPGLHSGLYVPMMIAERIIGVISIESEETNAFSESDERLTVTLAAQAAIAIENAQLLDDLKHSNTSLTSAYDATIEGWSRAMDLRDKETEGHTLRVTELTLKMARFMGLQEEEMIQIRRGGLLHDIGKLGVPDNILFKSESLTDAEWEIMRRHPTYAYEMLSSITYLEPALAIPYCHHEKWDGSGYPRGLKGEQIPLVARIFALVDVWDALTSDRPYRPSWTRKKSLEFIRDQSGKHFDPQVVEAFMKLITVAP